MRSFDAPLDKSVFDRVCLKAAPHDGAPGCGHSIERCLFTAAERQYIVGA